MDNKLIMQKRVAHPSLQSEQWLPQLFEYMISYLVDKGSTGAIYAELMNSVQPIEIKFCSEHELMLSKKNKAEVIVRLDLAQFTKFISYLIREVLRSNSGSIASGVLDVSFDGNEERHFAISARRSSSLGSYFQIDQFSSHL